MAIAIVWMRPLPSLLFCIDCRCSPPRALLRAQRCNSSSLSSSASRISQRGEAQTNATPPKKWAPCNTLEPLLSTASARPNAHAPSAEEPSTAVWEGGQRGGEAERGREDDFSLECASHTHTHTHTQPAQQRHSGVSTGTGEQHTKCIALTSSWRETEKGGG